MSTAPTGSTLARTRFPALDAVRALGAAMVVATHVAFRTGRIVHGPFSGTLARMDIGVALFFVLSGFLLFRPHVVAALTGAPAPATGRYLWRRALRILPAYWVVVVAAMLLLDQNTGHRRPVDWLSSLTLTQVYVLGHGRAGLTQTWSLCTEAAFYLALPLLARLALSGARRGSLGRTWALVAGLAVVPVLWQVVLTGLGWVDARTGGQWLPGYLGWFAAGMALAAVQVRLAVGPVSEDSPLRRLEELAQAPGVCWAGAVAVLAVAASPVAGPRSLTGLASTSDGIVKGLLYGAFAALVVLPLVLGRQDEGQVRAVLASRVLRRLGTTSYGVFLWHLLVLELAAPHLQDRLFTGSWLLVFAVVWGVSLVLAELSYRLVEAPAMRLGSRAASVDQRTASAVRQSA